MKKLSHKIAYSVFIFALTMLGSALFMQHAQAAVIASQTDKSKTDSPASFMSFTAGQWTIANTKIGAVLLNLKAAASISNEQVIVNCSGTDYYSDTTNTIGASSFTDYIFYFNPGNQCNLATETLNYIQVLISGSGITYGASPSDLIANVTACTPGGGGSCTDLGYDLYFVLYDQTSVYNGTTSYSGGLNQIDPTSNGVAWQSPPYVDGMISPDFNNFIVCENIATGASGSGTTFYLKVNYGTSTPSGYTDKWPWTDPPYAALNHLPTASCNIISKSQSLSTGNYQAQAWLYRVNPFDPTDELLATSTILHFNIISGTAVNYPSQDVVTACPSTTFKLDFGSYVNVDFGQGLCQVGRFLIVPQTASLQLFSGLWTSIEAKPPFGYFSVYEAQIASTTPTSTPTTSFNVAIPVFLSSIFTPLDVGVAGLIGFLTAWWFYHRGRNLKL